MEEENRRLKHVVAELTLDNRALKDVLSKNWLVPASRREAASYRKQYTMSERHACRLMGMARSTKRYRNRRRERENELRQRLRTLALERPRFGYRRLCALLAQEGQKANHKCVYRLYRAEGLVVRRRRRKRLVRGSGFPAVLPQRCNQRWSMDFVSDCIGGGRTIRALTLVDDYTRECLAIEVDTSLGGMRVRRVLEAVLAERARPEAIVVDNGPEFRGRALELLTISLSANARNCG